MAMRLIHLLEDFLIQRHLSSNLIKQSYIGSFSKVAHSLRQFFYFLTLILFFFPPLAFANPEGGVVAAGSATISAEGATTTINQSTDKAVIDWRSFNIQSGETTRFNQPASSSWTLNRVDTNAGASRIFGNLSANGNIMIINNAGILFGAGSRVDVNGLIASTANISNSDFMAGRFNFQQSPEWHNGIVNEGTIRAGDEGLVALIAPGVENRGVIEARMGKVLLAAGNEYTVDLYGDQLINFGVNSEVTQTVRDPDGNVMSDGVKNSGAIIADGGKVLLTARVASHVVANAINMTGMVQANSVSMRNGEIVLDGGEGSTVRVSGKLVASGKATGQKGGKVKVLAKNVVLEKNAVVDASGDTGGGEILIGGNYQGKGPEMNAYYTGIDQDVILNADAITQGNGGKVIVWADGGTEFFGNISALGGALGGDGGFVETSGKEYLSAQGYVDASATLGNAGQWLLDPSNIIITNVTANGTFSGGSPNTFTTTANDATVNVATINTSLNAGTSVTILTTPGGTQNGDITVNSAISKTAGANATLTLTAANTGTLNVNQTISSTTGTLATVLNGGTININSNVTTNDGNFTSNSQNATTLASALSTGTGTVTFNVNQNAAGAEGFNLNPGGSITTTNTGLTAAAINVNAAGGGTGGINLAGGNITTGSGGRITLATNTGGNSTGGSILQTAGILSNGSGSRVFSVPTASTSSIGTVANPIAATSTGTLALTVGSGGAFINNTGSFTLLSRTAAANSALSLVSSGALTLPGVAISTGTGDLNLRSNGGALATSATLTTSSGAMTLVGSTGVTLGHALTTGSGNINISNTASGDITESGSGSITSTSGNLNITSLNTLTLALANNVGSGTITLNANSDGAGATGLVMGAGSSLTTTNTTAGAVTINVNTAGGGTGTAALRSITTGSGGTLTVNSFGGSITQIAATLLNVGSGVITMTTNQTAGLAIGTGAANILSQAGTFNGVTGTGAIFVNNNQSLALGNINTTGAATFNVSGNITQISALNITGVATFTVATALSDILLGSFANNFLATPIITNNGNVRDLAIRNAAATAVMLALPTGMRNLTLIFDAAAMLLPAITLTNSLTATASGAITQSGAITAPTITAKTLNNTGSAITLANAANNATNVDLRVRNAADSANANAAISYRDADAINITNLFTGGAATVTAGNTITQTNAMTASSLTAKTLNNTGAAITLTTANIIPIIDLRARNAADSANVNGALSFTGTGGISISSLQTLGNMVIFTTGGTVTQTGTISGGTLIATGLGGITLNLANTLTGFNATNSSSGDIQLTNTGNLSITGVGLTGGGNLVINNTGTTAISGLVNTNTANATINSTGAISQTAAITGNTINAKTLNNAGATIDLSNSGNNAVNINLQARNAADSADAAGVIQYVDSNGFNVNAINTTGTLNLTAGGTVTQSGVISVTGATTLTASAATTDILLASAANNFGTTPTITSNGNIRDLALRNINASAVVPTTPLTLRNLTLIFDNAGMNFGTTNLSGDLTATASGAITQSAPIAAVNIIAKTLNNTGAAITLNNANNVVTNVDLRARNAADSANAAGTINYRDVNAININNIATTSTVAITAGNTITQSGSILGTALTAKTLNNSGAAITLTNAGNSVTSANLQARNAADSANVAGALNFQNAGGFDITGMATLSTIGLTSGGVITQSGTMTGTTLTISSIGGMTLNAVNTLTGFNATNTISGNIALTNTGNLSVTGVSQAGGGDFVLNNTGTTSIDGLVATAAGNSTINSTGVVSQTAAITSNTLTVKTLNNSGAAITLNNASNNVTNVDLRARNAADTTTVAGAISYQDNDTVNVNAINTASTIGLITGGLINQSGAVVGTTLTTTSIGGTLLTNAANNVTAFNGTNTVGGDIQLTNVANLSITGISESGGNFILNNTGTTAINGLVATGGGNSTINSTGVVSQTAAITGNALNVKTLNNSGSTITLNNAANNVTNINLQTRNAADTSTVAAAIVFQNNAGFDIANIATGSTANLTSTGPIIESGSVNAGTLTVNTVGGATLNGTNTITNFNATNTTTGGIQLTNTGNLSITEINQTGGDFILNNTGTTSIDGLVATAAGNSTINSTGAVSQTAAITGNTLVVKTLNNSGATITLNNASNNVTNVDLRARNAADSANVAAAINYNDSNAVNVNAISTLSTIGLTSGGAITQSGAITGTTLTTSSVGGATFNSANTLTGFNATNTTSGNIALTNTGNLSVAGVSQAGGGNFVLNNTGNIAINGNVATAAGNSTLNSSGTISQSAAITGATLTTSSVGGTTLNSANTLTGFSATNTTSGDIAFTNTGSLSITGVSQSGGNFTLNNTGTTAINGLVATGSGNSTINSTGAVSQTAAITGTTVAVKTLNNSGATITLNNAANNATNINLQARNAADSANVAAVISYTDSNAVNVNNIATLNTIGLTAGGVITQSGAITGTTLTTSSLGGTTLNGANTLTGFNATNTTTGDIAFTNTGNLSVTGVSQSGGNFVLNNTGTTAINGNVATGAGNSTINSTGAVSQTAAITGNALAVKTLNNAGAAITLNNTSNNVTNVDLRARNAVDGSDVVAAISYIDTDAVNVNSISTLSTINLTAGNTITQSGTITGNTLTAKTLNNSGAAITLNNTSNGVTNIDLQARNAADSANVAGAISYADVNDINVNNIATLSTINLTATGLITQSGAITGSTLTTSTIGGMTLNGANTLTGFNATNTTSGNIAFTNTGNLSITGVSQVGGGNLIVNNTGTTSIDGLVATAAGNSTINSTGAVSQTAAITGNTLAVKTLNNSGAIITLNNTSNNLTNIDLQARNAADSANVAGAISYRDTNAININTINTASTVDLIAGGAISQSGSATGTTLTAKTLNLPGAGINLNGSNAFDNIDLRARNATDTANSLGAITYTDTDGFNINTVTTAGTVTLRGGDAITQSGNILATLLTVLTTNNSGAAITLNNAANNVSSINLQTRNAANNANVAGAINYTDLNNVSVNGIATLSTINLIAGGLLSQTGAITGSTLTASANGGMTLNSANTLTGFNATNTTSGDIAFTNTGNLSVTGIAQSGGNFVLNNTGTTAINGLIATGAGNSTINSTDAVSQTAAITGNALAVKTLNNSGAAITLNSSNNVASIDLEARNAADSANVAGNISFTNTGAISVANVSTASDVSLTAGGNITQTGAITAPGVATFTVTAPSSDILLASAANDLGTTPTITNNGNVRDLALRNINASAVTPSLPTTLRNLTLVFDNAGVNLPSVTLSGDLSVIVNGDITQSGIISLNGISTFTVTAPNSDILLDTQANNLGTTPTITDNGNVRDLALRNVATSAVQPILPSALRNLTLTFNNAAMILTGTTLTGNLNATAGDNITQTGALSVAGNATLTLLTPSSDIDLASYANNFVLTPIITNNGNIRDLALRNINAGATIAALPTGLRNLTLVYDNAAMNFPTVTLTGALSATAGGNITQTGVINLGSSSSFTLTTPNSDILLDTQANNLGTALTIADNGNVRDLALRNIASGAIIPDLPTALRNLTLIFNNAAMILPSVTVTGNLDITAGGNITQTGALNVAGGSATFTVTNSNIDILLNDANDFAVTPVFTNNGNIRDLTFRNVNAGAVISALPNSMRNLTLIFDNAAMDLPSVTLTGDLSATAGGAITQNGIINGNALNTSSVGGTTLNLANVFALFNSTNTTSGDIAFTNNSNLSVTGVAQSGGNFVLNNTGTTSIDGLVATAAGNSTINSTGAVSQTAAITGNTLAVKTLNNSGAAITLNNASNNVVNVDLRARNAADSANVAGAITYNDINATNINALNTSSTLDITAGGSITQTGVIIANGTSTFTTTAASSDILLASAANNFAVTPVFTNNGNILDLALRNINASATITALPTGLRNLTLVYDNAAMNFPTVTLTGALSATAGGNITQTGVINLGSSSSFTLTTPNSDIVLDTQANNLGTALTITDNGNVRDLALRNVASGAVIPVLPTTLRNLTLTFNNADMILPGVTVTGDLNATAGGNITQTGALITAGNATFTLLTPDTDVNVGSEANDFALTPIITNNGNIRDLALRNINAGATIAALPTGLRNLTLVYDNAAMNFPTVTLTGALSATAGGNITQTGVINLGSSSSFTLTTPNSDILLDTQANNLGTALTIADNGNVRDLALRNVASGAVIPVLPTTLRNLTLTFNNADMILPGVTVTGNLIATAGGNITQTGALITAGNATFTLLTPDTDIDISTEANNFATTPVFTNNGNIQNVAFRNIAFTAVIPGLPATYRNVTFIFDNASMALPSLNLSGNLNITSNGAVTQTAALTVGGVITIAAGNANNITLNNSANNVSGVAITSGNNVDVVNNAALNLGTSTINGTLNINTQGALTQSGVVTTNGATTINTNNNAAIFNAVFNGSQDFTIDTGVIGNLTFNANATLGNLTITNTNNFTNNAIINAASFIQNAGNVANLGNNTLNAGNASITTYSANGSMNVASLLLNVSFANLFGTINGLSGFAAAQQVVLAHTIALNTQFFNGFDLANLTPAPTSTPNNNSVADSFFFNPAMLFPILSLPEEITDEYLTFEDIFTGKAYQLKKQTGNCIDLLGKGCTIEISPQIDTQMFTNMSSN